MSRDSLPNVLRRRVRELENDYNEQFIAAIARAADELELRERHAAEGENLLIEAVGVNRQLRNAVVKAVNGLSAARRQRATFDPIPGLVEALKVTTDIGLGLRLLVIQVGDDQTREDLLEKVTEGVDAFYAKQPKPATQPEGEPNGEANQESKEVDPQYRCDVVGCEKRSTPWSRYCFDHERPTEKP